MAPTGKDQIYAINQGEVSDFTFDRSVVEVFPDMIKRSVPGYPIILDTIGQLAAQYAQPDSNIYDLGCSLGAASLSMARQIQTAGVNIISIDNSAEMVARCQQHIAAYRTEVPISVSCQDVLEANIENASIVVLNFTLQFIAPDKRADVVSKIYDGLRPGGILILSEKIKHPSDGGNELLIDLHHNFKRQNGYSELEISQKRSALENVMQTDSFSTHDSRLKDAGFSEVVLWFKWFNFCSIVAKKDA